MRVAMIPIIKARKVSPRAIRIGAKQKSQLISAPPQTFAIIRTIVIRAAQGHPFLVLTLTFFVVESFIFFSF